MWGKLGNNLIFVLLFSTIAMSTQVNGLKRVYKENEVAFLKEIQFDDLVKKVNWVGGAIDPRYLPIPSVTPFFDHQWSCKEYIYEGEKGLYFRKGNEIISINYYYHLDLAQSINSFLNQAFNTTMFNIPYKLGPSDIGDISVVNKLRKTFENSDIIYIRKNLVIHISSDNSNQDNIKLAKWIDNQLRYVPLETVKAQIPLPEKLEVVYHDAKAGDKIVIKPNEPDKKQAIKVKVGDDLIIQMYLPKEGDPNRYRFEQNLGDKLTLCVKHKLPPFCKAITAEKPGKGVYKYKLFDSKTLLAYHGEFTVDIEP